MFGKIYLFLIIAALSNLTTCSEPEPVTSNAVAAVNADSIEYIKKNKSKIQVLDAVIKNRVRTLGFNGCVLVAQQGHVIYRNAFGFSNLKTRDSLKINSAFQLASTSKTMTAGAILLLKEQGKLQLTDKVQKYFPEFPYNSITLQMLLNHRSGLSNYIYFAEPFCDADNRYKGKPFDNAALLEIIDSLKPALYATPNKKFEYCNTNYALLASVIEKVSGQSYATFMDSAIFKPLGMSNTWVYSTKNDTVYPYKTKGHTPSGTLETQTYADNVVGDKGIYSTVDDLYKWSEALFTGKILKKETLDEAYTGYSNEHPGKRNYGYGWRITDESPTQKIVYHNGWWHGYSTLFYRRLSNETTVILLSNKYSSSTYHIEDILAVLNNSHTEFLTASAATPTPSKSKKSASPPKEKVKAASKTSKSGKTRT